MAVEERTSVRVILVGPGDAVLLLGARNPDDGRVVWCLPGGGVEASESLEEAARRELREELGIEDKLPLIGPIWRRKHRFVWDGRELLQHEGFFVAGGSIDNIDPKQIRIPGREGTYSVGARWATVEALKTWPGIVAPRRLAELLSPVLRGEFPDQPIDAGI